jgi:type IV pilus assembly protein PilO
MSAQEKSFIDELNTLSTGNPGTWSPVQRTVILAIVVIAIVLVGWLLIWSGQWEDIEREVQQTEKLKEDWLSNQKATVNQQLYRDRLAEIERAFGSLLKQLPGKTEVEALLVEVNQAGLGRGLQFDLFKPDNEVKREFYAELPVQVQINGTYNDIGAFVADISRLPRIVTLNNISVTPTTGGQLNMGMTLKTFRYMEAGETAGGGRK